MIKLGRRSDTIVALFVVSVTAMFLLYVPPFAVDLLIVVNLASAILLLLVALYVPDPAKLYAFPAVLLLSTLFRLGLNVATTRLILLNGYAGEVIQSFGQFLIRGEVVVGVVIFSIITIVNYIVVARGASRVAEVAARFTLDALPVKQMAIESDMRAGILTAQEAVQKREDLRKESQLYGSMDGAMKFVQGDVIAGIVIIFTNIFGGLYVGIRDGLSISEAVQTYTILTVGDGLVSQIPALLIAICSGIVVTRVASGTEFTLGMDLGNQLLKRPEAWTLSGLIMFAIALLPGPPFLPFALGGTLFLLIAHFAPRIVAGLQIAPAGRSSSSLSLLDGPSKNEIKSIRWSGSDQATKVLVLELDSAVLYPQYVRDLEGTISRWDELQGLFYQQVGLKVSPLKIVSRDGIGAGGFKVLEGGVPLFQGQVPLDSFMVSLHPNSAPFFGLSIESLEVHPLFGTSVFWTQSNFGSFGVVRAAQLQYNDQVEFIFLKIIAYLQNHPEELISVSDVYTQVKELSANYPGLVGGLIDNGLITVPRLTKVVQQLVREGFYVGNLRSIIEELANYYSSFDSTAEIVFVLDDVVNAIRSSRGKEILASIVTERSSIRVLTLDSSVKSLLEDIVGRHDASETIRVDRETISRLKKGCDEALHAARDRGVLPSAVFCDAHLKTALLSVLLTLGENIRVVIDSEIDTTVVIEEVSEWRI